MRGEKLRSVFESLGYQNVSTLLASGNVLFESESTDVKSLEAQIEKALPEQLGFTRAVIIRSQEELQELVDANPFADLKHQNAGKTYLTVTFFKTPPKDLPAFPFQPEGKSYKLIAGFDDAICSVVDLTTGKTPDLMTWLERRFGKEITTRTWLTVNRLLTKLDQIVGKTKSLPGKGVFLYNLAPCYFPRGEPQVL